MARLRRQPAAAAVRRAVYAVVLGAAVLLLGSIYYNDKAPAAPAGASSHGPLDDADTVAQLFQLATESEGAADFALRLKEVGLSGGGSSEADDGGASTSASRAAGGEDDAGGGGGGGGLAASSKYEVPLISKELAHKLARDRILVVTWANSHFLSFVENWVHHVKLHGITNYLIGAMDAEIGQALASQGLNVFAMYDEGSGKNDTGLGTADFGWGSPTFHKMGRQKVDLARTFTDYGLDLCLCDVDTVWINDPTDYFESLPDADILASSDNLDPSNPQGDPGLEQLPAIHSAMNIGLLFFRHSKNTTLFIDAWQQRLEESKRAWDQNVFNEVAHDGLLPFDPLPNNDRLVWGANHSLVFGVLPVSSFASGHTFFVQRLFEFQQVKPYVVHTTFQYGGTSGKRHRLREAMLWVDPPEYYSEGPFLSVDLVYPEVPAGFQVQDEIMMGTRFKTDWKQDDMIDFHLKAIGLQLKQMKTAFKLAVALNRTIIMPKLLSFCDRYWGPVEFCQIPGAFKTRLPFVAPLDHVFEPFNFDAMPEETGPVIRFREFSFLANQRTPASVKEGALIVTPTPDVDGAQLLQGKDGQQVLHIPPNQSDAQLRALLAPYSATKRLHFSSTTGAFGSFEDQHDLDLFQRRIMGMMGFFCCKEVKEGEDGGYAYAKFMEDPSQ